MRVIFNNLYFYYDLMDKFVVYDKFFKIVVYVID